MGTIITKPASSGGSGGSGSGIHAILPLASGGKTSVALNAGGQTSTSQTNTRLYSYPFIPNQSITTSDLYIFCTGLQIGALGRILIYSDSNGLPTTKLYESADLDLSTTGTKTATTTFNFVAGTRYWLTYHAQGTANISVINTSALISIKLTDDTMYTYYWSTAALGSAPTTFTITGQFLNVVPFIGITKA